MSSRFAAPLTATIAVAAACMVALPALASTMPRADIAGKDSRYFGLGIGNGLSASVDFALNKDVTLGASLGTGLYQAEYSRFDIRLLYDFVNGGRRNLSVAGIIGLWGGSRWGSAYSFAPGIEIGFGLAYPFTRELTGRLNLVVPYYGLSGGPYYDLFGGPSGGVELAYKFQPHIEGTIGSNGQGNLLGLKLNF
ncbi:hypothetical protein D3C86_1154940 [compost metagenome]